MSRYGDETRKEQLFLEIDYVRNDRYENDFFAFIVDLSAIMADFIEWDMPEIQEVVDND